MSTSQNSDAALYGQGVAFPPRLGDDGRLLWSSGPTNVRESIEVILLTALGERIMRPTFGAGLPSFLFRPNTVATHRLIEERARQALGRWEARIRLDRVTAVADPEDPGAARLTVTYRLVATGVRAETRLTLQLGR